MSSAPTPLATEPSPGVTAAIGARNAVDEALLAIPQIPLAMDRAGIGDRLLRAVQCAYAVIDSHVLAPVHHDGLAEALALVREAHALLSRAGDRREAPALGVALDRLGSAAAALAAGADAVAQIQFARRSEPRGAAGVTEEVPEARPFRASVGVPSLHAFARRPLVPQIALDPVVPISSKEAPPPAMKRPETVDALKAFAAAAKAGALRAQIAGDGGVKAAAEEVEPLPLPYEPAIEEAEMLRRLARDCLEDMAAHRDLRKPNAIETWLDQAPFEQRLLDNLDCFASIGPPALPLVSLFFAEAKAPDPGRAFALALALGSIEGRDTVDAAVATLKQSDPETYPGWVEGFWLAPSPAIDGAMIDLCTSSRPALVALALDVLHARGAPHDEIIAALVDRAEPEIASRVTRALATALPRWDAVALLERRCQTADDEAFFTAVTALLRRGHAGALDLLRAAADVPARRGRALALLCLAGRASDRDRLVSAAVAEPSPALLRGLGRFGHTDAIDPLISLLGHDDAEIVKAAAESLERITGAGLREIVEEPWEIELPPEAEEMGSLPVPTRKVERVVVDAERWSEWARENARRLDPRVKQRAGRPFTPLQIVDELEARGAPHRRRDEAAQELWIVTGLVSPFSTEDWVARQIQHLAELRARVARLGVSPGQWAFGVDPPATTGVASPGLAARAAAVAAASRPAEERAPVTVVASPPKEDRAPVMTTASPPAGVRAPVMITASPPAEDRGPVTAPPAVLQAAIAAVPFGPPPPDTSMETLDTSPDEPLSDALPFQRATVPAPAPTGPRHDSALPFRPAASAGPPVAGKAPAVPALTLEQYASLCAELAVFSKYSESVFQRHGLGGPAERAALDKAWRERLQRDPAEYQKWQALYVRWHAHWTVQAHQQVLARAPGKG